MLRVVPEILGLYNIINVAMYAGENNIQCLCRTKMKDHYFFCTYAVSVYQTIFSTLRTKLFSQPSLLVGLGKISYCLYSKSVIQLDS